jgi:hypothetical protein
MSKEEYTYTKVENLDKYLQDEEKPIAAAYKIFSESFKSKFENPESKEFKNLLYSVSADLYKNSSKTEDYQDKVLKNLKSYMLDEGAKPQDIDAIFAAAKEYSPLAEATVSLAEKANKVGVKQSSKVEEDRLNSQAANIKSSIIKKGYEYTPIISEDTAFKTELRQKYAATYTDAFAEELLSGKSKEEQGNILYSAAIEGKENVTTAIEKLLTTKAQEIFTPEEITSIKEASELERQKAALRVKKADLDIEEAAHSGGTNTQHQKGEEHIEPRAVDSVIFAGNPAMEKELASSGVDAITQAVREEILAKQQTLLQNEIAKLDAATPALTAKAAEIKSPEYWYEDQDIKGILEKQLGNKAIILPALSNSQEFMQSSIGANLAEITKDKPAVIPVNLGEKHWAAMSLHKDDKGDLVVFFNDPQGTPLNTSPDSESGKYIAALKKSMGEDKVTIIDLQTSQQTDGSSCGPFTSANLIALAELKSDELNEAAAKAKITAVGTDASAIRQSHGEITLAENTSKIKDMKPEDFRQYLQSAEGKEKVANLCKKPEIQKALNAIEVEGYKKIHTDFKDSFKDVSWAEEKSAGAKTKSCEIKNDSGEIVANIKETTHDKAAIEVKLENSESVKVNSYRTIDFPTKLEKENGPLHLSMAVKDENGKNIKLYVAQQQAQGSRVGGP